jgi:hypothetical protein
MEYAMSSSGLLVHSRPDWPCSMCRPGESQETRNFCLCLKCARSVVVAAGAGIADARELLDDVADALVMLECHSVQPTVAVN